RADGKVRNDVTAEGVARAIAIASGLGGTSAHTWLKVPVTEDIDAVETALAATTLPTVLLGGDVSTDPEATYERWRRALRIPTVRGLVVGRTLLYPHDGDVTKAVDTAVNLL